MSDAAQAALPLFDAHLHIVDPRFPLVSNSGYLPGPFTVADYRARTADLDVIGGAVVSGSFQGFDVTYLVDALARLGPGFVGVAQLPPTVSDAEVLELDSAGVRAVRFNLRRGGSAGVDDLRDLARRVADLAQWHVEVYADGRDLAELVDVLTGLPAVVIDHLGLSVAGMSTVLRLVESGAHVKATGFGRVDPDLDVRAALTAIAEVNPGALLVGTDLPSTRARRPFADADLTLVRQALGEERARAAFRDNALALYRP